MTTNSLLDPQLSSLFEGAPNPAFTLAALPMLRKAMAGTPIAREDLHVAEHYLDREDGTALRIVVIRQRSVIGPAPVVLHCHPGGWILGTPETSTSTLVDIACNLPCVMISVDYRLAPEHPYPAAHDDVMAALQWIRLHAKAHGFDDRRIMLVGESAGANIVAGIALRCRDEEIDDGIVGLSMVYSPLDDRTTSRPVHPFAGSIGLGAEHIRFAWGSYLGNLPSDNVSSYASPGRAVALRGLPPVFLATGAIDPVIDENLEFAQRLIRDGVSTTLHVFAGAPHGFDRAEDAQVTVQLRKLRREHLGRCLAL